MKYRTLALLQEGHLAIITLSSVTLDAAMAGEITETCQAIAEDDSVFVSILEIPASASDKSDYPSSGNVTPAFTSTQALAALECPVIAAIHGDAFGAALELAMACDIRIASSGSNFGLPQVQSGQMPSGGGTQRLPRLVGKGKASEMLLLGSTVDAREAHRTGLVNEVVAAGQVMTRAREMAAVILSRGPIAVRYAKEAVNKGMDVTLAQGLRLETDLNVILQTTEDRAEGVSAFLEKRKSKFRGR